MTFTEMRHWLQQWDPAQWERPEWLPFIELPYWVPTPKELFFAILACFIISQDTDSDFMLFLNTIIFVVGLCAARYFAPHFN